MRALIIAISVVALWGADEERLALALRAQADFDRVELAPAPALRDAISCVQAQASVIPVGTPEEAPLLHFRKGYCTLVIATLGGNSSDFAEAAAEFDRAIEAWPGRYTKNSKLTPEPVSSGLRLLAAVARLKGTPKTAEERGKNYDELSRAIQTHACPASLMPTSFCESLIGVGQRWAGSISLDRDQLEDAERWFNAANDAAWKAWTAGRKAFRDAHYSEAASSYRTAARDWEASTRDANRPVLERFSPQLDLAAVHTELGGAQLLAGDTAAAIASLTTAVREAPSSSRPLYLRARAKEIGGQSEAALLDYNLASRTAFAAAPDLASGEAHLYRGIVQFRRKDFEQAENEFASALNFEIPVTLRADATAWRHLAAVAGGSCESSRPLLEKALESVSPYFPKQDARAALAACRPAVTAAGTPSQRSK